MRPLVRTSRVCSLPNAVGLALIALLALVQSHPAAELPGWAHSGPLTLLTTPEGANLPATASLQEFPLLVRLHKEWFDFNQAQPKGEDIRFTSSGGTPLPYQIEEWNRSEGTASIWVRIPRINGNARQELRMHWGNPAAASQSNGKAVFNESNGYLSVWHLDGSVDDSVGTLETKDVGTTSTAARIGKGRHFAGRQGLFGGDRIEGYPSGSAPHSSEMWMRAEQSNGSTLAWGNEQAQGKVVMQFQSPPHVRMDCYFSGANVSTTGRLPLNEWIHVIHTYEKGNSRLYVNGALSGVSTTPNSPLSIKTPARLYIGGWYHNYDFVGDLDEVRVSKVARSADWIRLQYENQKDNQTLVGLIPQPGVAFSVSQTNLTVLEGQRAIFTAQAGGAQKIYWTLVHGSEETIVATDRFAYEFNAGRFTGPSNVTLRFKAVLPGTVKTQDIHITLQEDVPEPVFTLKAPRTWDGRKSIEILPQIQNLRAMQAKGAGALKSEWQVGPMAVSKEIKAGTLLLTRAHNSGTLKVTATLSNGGTPVTRTATIEVKEPKTDTWVARNPLPNEMPEDNQFYARNDRNQGTLYCTGTLPTPAEAAFLKLYADGALVHTERARLSANRSYAFAVPLKPGLIRYSVEFGSKTGAQESTHHRATNIVCGDAYLIDGQSNALATDTGETAPAESNEWIRSYGSPSGSRRTGPTNLWCNPVWKARQGEKAELGWWGMELAKQLVQTQRIPIFMINAAAGGTRIDQHQRNPSNPTDLSTLYGRMLWRLQQAKLTHGIRGILWHQGENDQGADGPTGGYGWETYQSYFVEMSAGWKKDFPNVMHYYIYQIWPDSCSMGGRDGSGDRLREKQRTLPSLYSNMSIMSTLGIRPPGGCHFPLTGWAQLAHLIQPLIERDHYGISPSRSITPPNLRQASYGSRQQDSILLEFDQPVVWTNSLVGQFYLDGKKGLIASGTTAGRMLHLKLRQPSDFKTITYLKETSWNQDTLLNGVNGIAALTFCEVPIAEAKR